MSQGISKHGINRFSHNYSMHLQMSIWYDIFIFIGEVFYWNWTEILLSASNEIWSNTNVTLTNDTIDLCIRNSNRRMQWDGELSNNKKVVDQTRLPSLYLFKVVYSSRPSDAFMRQWTVIIC